MLTLHTWKMNLSSLLPLNQFLSMKKYGCALFSVRTINALLEYRTDQDPEIVTTHANNVHGLLGPQGTQLFPFCTMYLVTGILMEYCKVRMKALRYNGVKVLGTSIEY